MGESAPKDPKREGRVREVVFENKSRNEVVGSVWWEKDEGWGGGKDGRGKEGLLGVPKKTKERRGGSVELESSITSVVLKL